MPQRVRPIRTQLLTLVLVPLISLVGLWGLATYLTVGDGVRLFNQGTLITDVAAPAEEILGAIQAERRASMVFLAAPTGTNRGELTRARAAVDGKIAAYRDVLARSDIQRIAPDRVMALAKAELTALANLPSVRSDVDGRRIDGRALMAAFTELADPITPFYAAVATFPDDQVSAEGQALQRLAHARELRARVDAVLAGALAADRFTGDSYVQFVQAVGLMRAEYHEARVQMTDQYRTELTKHFAAEPYPSLTRMEDAAIGAGGRGRIPVSASQWRDQNIAALADLSDFQLDLAKFVEEHAKAPAYWIFARILVAGLLGLIAIIITVVVSLRIARRLAARLRDLRQTAHTLANAQLPSVVERLRAGQPVDVDAEAPVLSQGTDEIGAVGDAFNSVRRTAISVAVEQADLRAGIRNVFLNIARRSQTLVRKQLSLLDVMERKTVDSEELADLFRMDHLATRMRRYAENLVILGGSRPGRTWGEPVPMQDVLRGAASEAEHYERVRVLPFPPVVLSGSVVSDVIHLVAELIDNGTNFSPPHTTVQVFGQLVPHGFAVEVEDRGLGMSEDDLAAANRWLSDPPEFNVLALSESPRLGMFVVARIAARHGIKVALRSSAYGGITAIVLVPPQLVAEADAADELTRREAAAAAAEPAAAAEAVEAGDRAEAGASTEDAPQLVSVSAASTMDGSLTPPLSFPVRLRGDQAGGAHRSSAPSNPSRTAPLPLPAPSPSPQPTPIARAMPAWGAGPEAGTGWAAEAAPSVGSDPDPDPQSGSGSGSGSDEPTRTHLGLPVRVRQARLAPGLRNGAEPAPPTPATTRSPEEIRQMMSAYQRGTARGRQSITGNADRPSTSDADRPVPAEEEKS